MASQSRINTGVAEGRGRNGSARMRALTHYKRKSPAEFFLRRNGSARLRALTPITSTNVKSNHKSRNGSARMNSQNDPTRHSTCEIIPRRRSFFGKSSHYLYKNQEGIKNSLGKVETNERWAEDNEFLQCQRRIFVSCKLRSRTDSFAEQNGRGAVRADRLIL